MEKGLKRFWVAAIVPFIALMLVIPAMAEDKIVIGSLSPLSGAYASLGEDFMRGANYAVEEVGGKVIGKPIELMFIDTEVKPGVAARKVREAVDSKGVKFFTGCASSGVALAVSQVAMEKEAVFNTSVGADAVTGSKCNRFTFRWSIPTYGAVQQTVKPLIKKFPEAKRWYTITPDYVFGHSLLNNAKAVFKEFGVEHVGNDMHPIGHTEFSSFITKAMAAKADFVVFFNFGKDTINALKQANNFGLTKKAKILVAWSSGLRDIEEIGPESCEGVYFGCQFWHDVNVPLTKKLCDVWKKKYNRFPSYPEASAYIMTKMEIMGIQKAGTTDTAAVVKALEGMQYDGITGVEEIQAFDHQTKKNYYLLLAKPKKDIKGPGDNATIVSYGISVKSESESDCKMN
ncbi:MAG: ABC transporter substrate-binding protein [Proteobacteria bacterium]|nr:ABC transporter substrate-binding protein [Pseudomonadota bacterium]